MSATLQIFQSAELGIWQHPIMLERWRKRRREGGGEVHAGQTDAPNLRVGIPGAANLSLWASLMDLMRLPVSVGHHEFGFGRTESKKPRAAATELPSGEVSHVKPAKLSPRFWRYPPSNLHLPLEMRRNLGQLQSGQFFQRQVQRVYWQYFHSFVRQTA